MGNRYIETYGKQAIREALDIILIAEGRMTNENARNWLLKHGLIKKSTRTVRCRYYGNEVRREYRPGVGHVNLENPYRNHNLQMYNGRNQTVFSFLFRSDKLGELMEELENDTTTN